MLSTDLSYTALKVPVFRDFPGLYFPAFGLNTERYSEIGKPLNSAKPGNLTS